MNQIFVIKNFLDPDSCKRIIKTCLSECEMEQASVSNRIISMDKRNSRVSFIMDIENVNQKLKEIISEKIKVNGFTVSGLGPFQFTEYDEGGFYDWHTDSSDMFKERFYSAVILLCDDYSGGNLEVEEGGIKTSLEKSTGNLYLFPSHFLHRVSPVTDGVRYSLVNWVSLEKKSEFKRTLI